MAVIYDKTGLTERVVQTGDASALYQLGMLLDQREPSQPDYAQILYREAAAAGNRDATCRIDEQAEH